MALNYGSLFFRRQLFKSCWVLVLVLVPFVNICLSQPTVDGEGDFYSKGMQAKEQGNYKKALSTWEKAQTKLKEPDFRIAQAYIELVADQKLKESYKKASDIYFWGLSGKIEDDEKKALLKEVELIEPLKSYNSDFDLKKGIKKSNHKALKYLTNFWDSLDPTPLDEYNERLVEHWERATYVYNHFTKEGSKEFDDRGNIYLKYGDPYYTKSGRLKYNPGTVSHLLRRRLSPALSRLHRSTAQNATISSKMFNFESRIRSLHNNPSYEVWIYRDLTDSHKNTVYLFGSEGNEPYEEKDALDDFVPGSAFNAGEMDPNLKAFRNFTNRQALSSNNAGQGMEMPDINVTPAVVMQIMYYEQLAALDQYFGDVYNKMMDRYLDQSIKLSESMAREFESLNAGEMQSVQSRAPDEKTDYGDEIFEIPLNVYAYRFLTDGEPSAKLFVRAESSDAVYFNQFKNNSSKSNLNNYILESGYKVYNAESIVKSDSKNHHFNEDSDFKTTSLFGFQYKSPKIRVVAGVQLKSVVEDTSIAGDTPYPNNLKGVGKREITIEEPLDNSELVMSDLIWGYEKEGNTNGALPAEITHEKKIPVNKNVQFYYELYGLERGNDGRYRFKLSYAIQEKDKGFRLFKKKNKSEIGISINEETTSDHYKQLLEIDSDRLKKGQYEIQIEVQDLVSGEKFTKRDAFAIE